MEIWKDVIGYEGLYQVSNYGRVKALPKLKPANKGYYITKEIILKAGIDCGYKKVVLTNNGLRSTKKVHRLVASAFLGDKKDLCVNHIDSNRSNNNVNNLEWVTHLENIRHARANNRYPKLIMSENLKKILKEKNAKKVLCTKNNIIYDSATEASVALGIKRSTLIHYLLGTRKNTTSLKYL
jgi:hypothetical protein